MSAEEELDSSLAGGIRGELVENLVEQLCANSFFADFTIRSPKYYKTGGQQKEAADLLVWFRDTLMVLQIKTKTFHDDETEPSAIDKTRLSRAVQKALEQFRGIGELWRSAKEFTFINGRGTEVTITKDSIKNFVLVVVFAPMHSSGRLANFSIQSPDTCIVAGDLPLHVFGFQQFRMLLNVLDTLPDFLFHLDVRASLYSLGLISWKADPIDLWAFITFERPKLLEILESRVSIDVSGMSAKHMDSVRRLEEEENPSYLIDWIIEGFYAGLSEPPPVDERLKTSSRMLTPPNSPSAYMRVLPYLAQLNRIERTRLAIEFVKRIGRAKFQELSFGGLIFGQGEVGFVVLAAKLPRIERQVPACNLGEAFAFRMKLKHVICLVTGCSGIESDGVDALFVDATKLTATDELKRSANELFSPDAEEIQY